MSANSRAGEEVVQPYGSKTAPDQAEQFVRSAFREAAYRRYLLAEAVSIVGDQVWFVALSWAAVHLASPTVAGLVLAVSAIPRLLLMILGGPLADRYDVVKIMVRSDLLRAAVMFIAAGVALWQSSILLLVITSLIFGSLDAIFMPAAGSLRPRLLQAEQLSSGAALRELVMRAALTLGAPLGGALMAFGDLPLACLFNGITFIISMVALRTLRPRPSAPNASVHGESYARSLTAGFSYLGRHGVLRGTLAVILITNLAFVGPMNVGLALLSQERSWGASGIGALLASFGIGAALGAAALLNKRIDCGIGIWIGIGCALEGMGLSALALATELAFALLAAAAIGLASGPLGVMTSALTQSATLDEFRGRVSSVHMLINFGIAPLSMAAFGIFADQFGASTAILGSAVLSGLASTLCFLLPSLRRARMLKKAEQ